MSQLDPTGGNRRHKNRRFGGGNKLYRPCLQNIIGPIYITVGIYEDGRIRIKIRDKGCGIEDVKRAMEPLFTTGGEERAGLGFAVMESFTDSLKVRSSLCKGTTVTMEKFIKRK